MRKNFGILVLVVVGMTAAIFSLAVAVERVAAGGGERFGLEMEWGVRESEQFYSTNFFYAWSNTTNVFTRSAMFNWTSSWSSISQTISSDGVRGMYDGRPGHLYSMNGMMLEKSTGAVIGSFWQSQICLPGPKVSIEIKESSDQMALVRVTNTTTNTLYFLPHPSRVVAASILPGRQFEYTSPEDGSFALYSDMERSWCSSGYWRFGQPVASTTPTPDQATYGLDQFPKGIVELTSGSSPRIASVYANLMEYGRVITQTGIAYIWESSDWNVVVPSAYEACSPGIQVPCPYDHAILRGLKAGDARVKVRALRMSDRTTRELLAERVFDVHVVSSDLSEAATPTVTAVVLTATPTSTSTPAVTATPAPTVVAIPFPPTYLEIPLENGWNLISIPSDHSAYTARSLLAELGQQGIGVAQIAAWENGGWHSYLANLPTDGFAIRPGKGYFVRVTRSGTWYPGCCG